MTGEPASNAMRVVIVDETSLDRQRIRELLDEHLDIEIVGECASRQSAIATILRTQPDLVFLDINLPETDGFAVIDAIGSAEMPVVIFVTTCDSHAMRAFEANALDYVLKPFTDERLHSAVERARQRIAERRTAEIHSVPADRPPLYSNRLIVRRGPRYEIIRAEEVDWIEAANNYVKLHVGTQLRFMRGSISAVEERLDPELFLRIHRSTIVNLNRVHSIEVWNQTEFMITLENGTRLPSSRKYRQRVRRLLASPGLHTRGLAEGITSR